MFPEIRLVLHGEATPGREQSTVGSHRLPFEIWMEIIGEYSSRKERLALCKTSRFFHEIAQIFLYTKLNFNTTHDIIESRAHNSRITLFEKTIQARPELLRLILDLSFCVYKAHPLLSRIDQLPNVQRLRLAGTEVSAKVRDAIFSCRHLRVLEFDLNCELDESLLDRCQPYPQTSISDLKIVAIRSNPSVPAGLWATFALAGLRSLVVSSCISLDSNAILLGIMTSGHMLETLSIDFVPSYIIQFLASTPRLRHLSLHDAHRDDDYHLFSSLPGDAIPLLEHYHGPAKLAPILVRNRPVHTVELQSRRVHEAEYASIFDSLQFSSVPVTTLKISCTLKGNWLWNIPITTCHLSFYFNNFAIIDEHWIPPLSRLTDLRTISVLIGPQAVSREEIMEISETFPSLREIDLVGANTTWIMVEPKVWEKFKYHTEDEY